MISEQKSRLLILTWFIVIFVYVILAAAMPAITGLSGDTVDTLDAEHTMSNYPGTLEFLQAWPLLVWFIPGGVGIVVTAVYLKQE